ncbi:MAG TPA: class I SAM-dependent methyltransferase [Gaiellaceae bacterium]|nr:class I SAM-dependent methyltransferase [Gaiellaceae bacterium]
MAFEELKSKQSVMWGTGDYQNVTETLIDVHERVLDRLAPAEGVTWLDLACGTGAMAELATKRGADVCGIDLAPVLIETAKERAQEQGLDIDYRVGDCENLDMSDASFDVVSSTFGVMFAPDHEATARELARTVKPGGRIGLANWTPEGGLAKMFGMMKPFQPPPPEGIGVPFQWGSEAHVEELLGDAFELDLQRYVSHLRVPSGEDYWRLFASSYGPTRTLADSLDDDRREEFHQSWVDFFETDYRRDGQIDHDREWLFVYGTRR